MIRNKTTTNTAPTFEASTGEAASLGANQTDFFGEGLADAAKAPDAPARNPADSALYSDRLAATKTANINALSDRNASQSSSPEQQQAAYDAGNIGGASGAYNSVNEGSRAQYDYMHDLNDPSSVGDFFNSMGERVGVSHAGDAAGLTGGFNVVNPLDFNPLSGIADPNKGLGTNVDNGGKPLAANNPALQALGGTGILQTAAGAAGDALDQVMGGAGDIPVDTSGNDRGGMGLNGAYSGDLGAMNTQADASRTQGQGVLDGTVAPGGAGAGGQQDALDQAMGFLNGPRKQNDVMTDVNGFLQAPNGPSAAELQLQQGAQGNMADALSLARSGRARDAGSQARMMSQALANNAATGVDTNRDTALLRAKEAEARRGQDLSALGLKGNLAQGLDSDTLKALGLGGDLATQLRQGNITERGQGLSFAQGQNQIGAGLQSDALKTIPQLENIRHADQFDLTPQQKLAAAKLGGPAEKTTADYVTGLLGDVLSAL
jgi:hypothetical protein